jgi:D-3-phosphoglycerate dehydrogenase
MPKVVTTITKQRFKKFDVEFPQGFTVEYLDAPYTDEQLIRVCKDADYLFVDTVHPVTANAIKALPNIKMIHVEGVGYNYVDVEAAKAAGILVCNNKAVNNTSVAEHTIGLMLAGLRRTPLCDAGLKREGFKATHDAFLAAGQHEISAMHIGLVGIGSIGKEVAKRLKNWGCKISYYDTFRLSSETEKELSVNYMEFDTLLRECDIISLHVPVLPSTFHLISSPQFGMMKKTALLVNTARGEIIDDMALAGALESGTIYGAALDTLVPEPRPPYHPLLNLSQEAAARLILTPHIGGTTDEAFTRMLRNAIANMERMESGMKPLNVVY